MLAACSGLYLPDYFWTHMQRQACKQMFYFWGILLTSLPTVNVNEHRSKTSTRQTAVTEESQILGKAEPIDGGRHTIGYYAEKY